MQQTAKRVLIVEDDVLVAVRLQEMLEDEGYTIVGQATTREEAVAMTERLRPAVVMMDLNLADTARPVHDPAELDGIIAARKIAARCPTPIVALTAYTTPDVVEAASAAGIGYYLVKPTSRREVARGVHIAMARFDDLMQLRRLNAELQAEVAARKRTERALREREALLDATGQMAQVGGWDVDAETSEVRWTEQTRRIHGVPADYKPSLEEAINFFHPEDRKKLTEAVQRALDAGEPYDMEIRFITAQGKHLWVRTICRPGVVNGRTVRLMGTFQDITARKRAEQQVAHYTEELERSNGELQQFAYAVSHDLKAPLRAVKSFLGLLREDTQGQLDAKAEEYIHFAIDGTERMEGLIEALLDYARVDTRGRDPMPTDAEAVLTRVLDTLQFEIERRDAVVTHEPLPTVLADPTQLAQLFQNLIGNALKFCAQKPPRVHVTAEKLPRPPEEAWREGKPAYDMWRFAVRDNGIGIAPRHHERIFAVFERLHTREEYEGTGIGLAICKRIVERHGGRIGVDSDVGEGSTFYFTLQGAG
jgi:PAS domain S-box-containing protein